MNENRETEKNLLQGSLPRAILSLAGPMFASAILQNTQSLIDLYWVGRLGAVSVAALALSGAILMVFFPLQMGLVTGTVALVSRAYGAGDARRASNVTAQSLSLSSVIALILGFASIPFLPTLCTLLGAEDEVVAKAVLYLRPSMGGMVLGMILFMANSAMQAAGNTVLPMTAMVVSNILNLILDPLFIFGWGPLPGFGVAGAAWATLLAQALAGAGLLWVLFSGETRLHLKLPDFRPRLHDSITLIKIGLPNVAQMLSRSLMGLVFFRIIARFGTFVVAGYSIGMRWHMVLLMPCFVFGNATAAMVGQNLGAKQPQRAKRAVFCSAGMVLAVILVSIIPLFFFSESVVAFFDKTPEVVAAGSSFLRTVTPFYLFTAIAIVVDRAQNGAGQTLPPMVFTIVALWGIQVPLALWLSSWFQPPTQGVWWAMNTANAINMMMTTSWFATGRWMHKRL